MQREMAASQEDADELGDAIRRLSPAICEMSSLFNDTAQKFKVG
jgi:hypothetical protein